MKEKKEVFSLVIVYVLACILYCVFVSKFTIPVHLGVDEELYISMAKSFHFHGYFEENGTALNYSCYLYSIIISFAYYFFKPDLIMPLFRGIGVIIMLSSVFPAFFLALEMLEDRKKAWIVAFITMILPTMCDTAYCMQEVLAYPIVLWIFCSLYIEQKNNDFDKISINNVLMIIFCGVGYFVKTYLIFIPIVYLIFSLFISYKEKNKKIIVKTATLAFIMLVCFFVGKLGLYLINDGITGVNHYSGQFGELFPIDIHTIFSICSCILFYIVALLFYWGVFSFILPIINIKQYSKHDRRFILLLILSVCILIVEIVVSIVVTEEQKPFVPHKFLYRYFQIFEIPVICIFMKMKTETSRFGRSIFYAVIINIIMAIYFGTMALSMRTAIIDAPLFLLIENMSKYVNRWMGCIACLAIMLVCVMCYYICKKNLSKFVRLIKRLFVIGIVLFLIIDLIQLPYYTNVIADGTRIEEDAVKISEYISSNDIKKAYYIVGDKDRYERSIYAYLACDAVEITDAELTDIENDNCLFIKASDNMDVELYDGNVEGLTVLQVGLKHD